MIWYEKISKQLMCQVQPGQFPKTQPTPDGRSNYKLSQSCYLLLPQTHNVAEKSPAHPEGPQSPQRVQATLDLLVQGVAVMKPA